MAPDNPTDVYWRVMHSLGAKDSFRSLLDYIFRLGDLRLWLYCHPGRAVSWFGSGKHFMHNNRLRLDSSDGSAASEYRVEGGNVEVRTLTYAGIASGWRSLTPDQLSSHVERNTVVAQWLEHRLGWRRLLLACVGKELWCEARKSESGSSAADNTA